MPETGTASSLHTQTVYTKIIAMSLGVALSIEPASIVLAMAMDETPDGVEVGTGADLIRDVSGEANHGTVTGTSSNEPEGRNMRWSQPA